MKDLDVAESHGAASLGNGQLEKKEEPVRENEAKLVSQDDMIPTTTHTKKGRLQEKGDQPRSRRNRTGNGMGINR